MGKKYCILRVLILIVLYFNLSLNAHSADPSALLSNYALFGDEYLNFTEEAETQELGWVGTNGYLNQSSSWVRFNTIVKVKGSFDAGTNEMSWYKDTVYAKSSTTGDLSMVGDLLVTNAEFPDPTLPVHSQGDITVDNDNNLIVKGSRDLEPGRYGRILLNDDNAEIILTDGLYEIDTLVIRGTVRIPSLKKGVTRIIVRSYLHFDNAGPRGHRVVSEGDARGKVLLYCAGDVSIDQSSRIDAALVAPFADIKLATEIVVNGQIHAKSITFKNGFNGTDGTFIPFNPGNVIFPEYLKNGIPEDSLNQPKSDNSYLLSFPLLLTDAGEYNGSAHYEVLTKSSSGNAATEGEDFEYDSQGAFATGLIHFSPGDSISSDSIHIWIIDDPAHEPIEQIEVRLSEPDSVTFENGDSLISYFIPIESEDPEYNEMKGAAAALDFVGDGKAHSIRLVLSEDLQQSAVRGVTFQWPETTNEKTVSLSDITFLDNQTISFPVSSLTGDGKGTGLLSLDDGTEVVFSIVDSVGPVIVSGSAELLNEYSADTLTILVSEPIRNLESATISQFIIFEDSSDSEGDTIQALSVVKKGATQYEVTLSKGTLSLGDWAQFNYKAETEDLKGNAPKTYNQKVELSITVNKIPSFKTGALFDIDGPTGRLDGVADSGYVEIRLAADTARITMYDLTALRLAPKDKNISLDWAVVNDSLITFTHTDLQGCNSTTDIVLEFAAIKVEGSLEDSVAPVIIKAQYESWDMGDTLKVTFSEPINEWGNLTPFNLFSGSSLKVQRKAASGNNATYLVVGGSISKSDSIWIRADGEIADSSNVYQEKENNQHVPLSILTIISPIEAVFFDTLQNPDAYIDGIKITFSGALTDKMVTELRKTIVFPTHRGLSYRGADYEIDGATLYLPLLQDSVGYKSTATDSRDNIRFDHTVYEGDTALYLGEELSITDSMGPVVLGGLYTYGLYDEMDPTVDLVVDTLTVEFSEDVLIPDTDTPFGFVGAKGEYSMSIVPGTSTGKIVRYARIFRKGDRLPTLSDSIYLLGENTLSDSVFVTQGKDTKPVLLHSGTYMQQFRFTVYPNPLVLDAYGNFVNEYLVYTGDLDPSNKLSLIVNPLGIRPVHDTLVVDMALLDPVGNEIFQEDLIAPYRNEKGEWVFNVEPKNRNGRILGRGSYSLQLKVTGAGEVVHSQLLGVQQAVYPDPFQ